MRGVHEGCSSGQLVYQSNNVPRRVYVCVTVRRSPRIAASSYRDHIHAGYSFMIRHNNALDGVILVYIVCLPGTSHFA